MANLSDFDLNERSLIIMKIVGGLFLIFMPKTIIDSFHEAQSDFLKTVLPLNEPPGKPRRIVVRAVVLIIGAHLLTDGLRPLW